MTIEAKITPGNSLLLVMDKGCGEIPESMGGRLVSATSSCVAVGTLSEVDGETTVTLTDERASLREIADLRKVFSGILMTPNKRIDVCTVFLQPVLGIPVWDIQSSLEIWANSEIEPNRICVLVTNRLELTS